MLCVVDAPATPDVGQLPIWGTPTHPLLPSEGSANTGKRRASSGLAQDWLKGRIEVRCSELGARPSSTVLHSQLGWLRVLQLDRNCGGFDGGLHTVWVDVRVVTTWPHT